MVVQIRGRLAVVNVEQVEGGYFLRMSHTDAYGLDLGSVVKVDRRPFVIRYMLSNQSGEPEVWALVSPAVAIAREVEMTVLPK